MKQQTLEKVFIIFVFRRIFMPPAGAPVKMVSLSHVAHGVVTEAQAHTWIIAVAVNTYETAAFRNFLAGEGCPVPVNCLGISLFFSENIPQEA